MVDNEAIKFMREMGASEEDILLAQTGQEIIQTQSSVNSERIEELEKRVERLEKVISECLPDAVALGIEANVSN